MKVSELKESMLKLIDKKQGTNYIGIFNSFTLLKVLVNSYCVFSPESNLCMLCTKFEAKEYQKVFNRIIFIPKNRIFLFPDATKIQNFSKNHYEIVNTTYYDILESGIKISNETDNKHK